MDTAVCGIMTREGHHDRCVQCSKDFMWCNPLHLAILYIVMFFLPTRFDPWALLMNLKKKAVSLGVEYVEGKVTGLEGEVLDDMVIEGEARASIKNVRHAKVRADSDEQRGSRMITHKSLV